MRSAFRLDRTYRERFSDVWLWSDWPGPGAEPDTGIDLVARTPDGGYVAIQCKCYAPEHHLVRADIDSFFTTSSSAPTVAGTARTCHVGVVGVASPL